MKHLRRDYQRHVLIESDLEKHPFAQFRLWFEDAVQSKILEPNAMTLATMNGQRPAARIVLLKELDDKGFVFFTNYNSRKGNELKQFPQAALLFFWDELERQVRIEGKVQKIKKELSKNYFDTRPKASRIGALASNQSQIIPDRAVLESKVKALEIEYKNHDEIPMPQHWGGYRLIPDYFEFWQGRSSRLHDRLVYEKKGTQWKVKRLAP